MSLEDDLLQSFVELHPIDAARALSPLRPAEVAEVLSKLSTRGASRALARMAPLAAARALELLPTDAAASFLASVSPDDGSAISRVMRAERRAEVLAAMPDRNRSRLEALLRYADGTAGALMDPRVVAVGERATARDALREIEQSDAELSAVIYVTGEDRRLAGAIEIEALLRARPDEPVTALMRRAPESVAASATAETVLASPAWMVQPSVPVTDSKGRLVGVLRYQTARALERRLVEDVLGREGLRAASALGELYGVGLRGVVSWAASLIQPEEGEA